MKTLVLTLTVLIFPLLSMQAAPPEVDLHGKLAEDFDWAGYFSQGDQSVSGEMEAAQAATVVLKRRMDELCGQYRALMIKRGEAVAVKRFDDMQEQWQKYAEAEVALVGSAWEGGSGARAAYPKHRCKVYLRRVKELRELKADCMFLNE